MRGGFAIPLSRRRDGGEGPIGGWRIGDAIGALKLPRGHAEGGAWSSCPVNKEMARTHNRRMCQKLAVHSREELMDLVEEGMPRPDQRTAVNSPVSESIT